MKKLTAIPSLLLLSLAGCAAETTATDEPIAADQHDSLESVSVTLEATDTTIVFHAVEHEGGVLVDIAETSPIGYRSPIQKAMFEQSLTTLELFMAITDETAPDWMSQAHVQEAQELGRDSDAVRSVTLDLEAPVDKISQAQCDQYGWIGGDADTKKQRWDNVTATGDEYFYIDKYNANYKTADRIRFAVCNDSDVRRVFHSIQYDNGLGWKTHNHIGLDMTDPGWVTTHSYRNVRYTENDCAWSLCPDTLHKARYRLKARAEGWYSWMGNAGLFQYDVRSAVLRPIVK